MVATSSTMLELGTPAPGFKLVDTREYRVHQGKKTASLTEFEGKPLLLMFICNHCPYVVHIARRMAELANQAQSNGYAVAAISANDVQNYPQDGPEAMADFAEQYGFEFPYLYDETQNVAKAFGAACTPDFYLFNAAHYLVYRGQMDASRPGNSVPVSGDELSLAINALSHDKPINQIQVPSIGCNIKWKPGNEPDYF